MEKDMFESFVKDWKSKIKRLQQQIYEQSSRSISPSATTASKSPNQGKHKENIEDGTQGDVMNDEAFAFFSDQFEIIREEVRRGHYFADTC